MNRVDLKSAKDASPVEISMRIFDALIDASQSQEAEIVITFKKDLKDKGYPSIGTGVRIEYGSCNTFNEALEFGRSYDDDVSNLTGVFRFLSKALAQQNEDGEREVLAAHFDRALGALNVEAGAKGSANAE
jgi:hypothetical protein